MNEQLSKLDLLYKGIMLKVQEDVNKSMEEAYSQLYTDYLPFIEEDTKGNFEIAVNDCLKRLLNADYKLNDYDSISIDSPYGYMTISVPYDLSEKLAIRHKDIIISKRITDLESEVGQLRQLLERRF